MDKVKINLLPKEVLEKRRAEGLLTWMILGVIGVVGLLVAVYSFNFVRIMQQQSDLDVLKAENVRYEREIAKIADFEKNKILVEEKEKLVRLAIAKKYSWSKLLNNISLIVPNEVWLTELSVKEGDVDFSGSAIASKGASKMGQRSVAKWLVHLSEIDDVGDVWLSSSKKSSGSSQDTNSSQTTLTSGPDKFQFETKAKIKSFQEDVDNSSSPAPPEAGGKT